MLVLHHTKTSKCNTCDERIAVAFPQPNQAASCCDWRIWLRSTASATTCRHFRHPTPSVDGWDLTGSSGMEEDGYNEDAAQLG